MAKQINDFQDGDHYTIFALVKDAQVRTTKKGAKIIWRLLLVINLENLPVIYGT